ncbi:MAG TPA: histidine phosphatase family protein [Verrucomicrobiae bacterium]|nr:histidine phosphatase family protein [Verrucomicrobiae bacterium]
MKQLFYVRHGESEDLAAKIRSRTTTELTTKGWRQATEAGELLRRRSVQPDLIVCSELIRTRQSAEAIADVLGYSKAKILPQSLLNERLWGEGEGVLNEVIGQKWDKNFDIVPGAEPTAALQIRAGKALAWLRELKPDCVLVVGHGTIGRAIVRAIQGRPYTDEFNSERGEFKNGEIAQLLPNLVLPLS